ncbi:C-terminal binding protein [Tropicimonas marinistellae]|uniref:C-terminal binding protein n=1 Tax=Tropicimonas marinistellae TaxID=1739787 RepID=UPI00082EA2F6|nr:C-terminal binding protein [Tropicimonas marinistellae]
MSTPIVAVLEPGYADYDVERSILGPLGIEVLPVPTGADAVSSLTGQMTVGLMVREREVSERLMNACPDLRVVVRYGVGVDNIDLDAARARLVKVANVPDYGAEIEVSEQAVALYLAVQRRIVSRDSEVRAGAWAVGQAATIPGRDNATLGMIGCGKIGMAAARKFSALGFTRTLAHDPNLTAEKAAAAGIERADLDTIYREADVLSLHAPLTPETRHMIGAAELALLKPTSILVNVSRGGLVDEVALAQALHQGRLFGAGVDVFEQEPVSADNPLLSAPNTVLSDHAGWYSERSVRVLQSLAAKEVARVLEGTSPRNWMNSW